MFLKNSGPRGTQSQVQKLKGITPKPLQLASLSCPRLRDGGARRDRTADLLRARQALSQLSYGPRTSPLRQFTSTRLGSLQATRLSPVPREEVVGLGGFEPPTSPLSGVRSNQLSYRPKDCTYLSQSRTLLDQAIRVDAASYCPTCFLRR
jgi:hypothetical protein